MVKRSYIFDFLAKNLILISFIYEIVDSSTIQNEDTVFSRVSRDVFAIEDFDAYEVEKPDRSSLYNPEYFEGDITNYGLSSHTLKELTGEEKGVAAGRNAIANPLSKWNKVGEYVTIPFELSNDFTPYPITVIDRAFQEFQKRTCIKFVERTTANNDYIYIEPGAGCNSAVGKQGGKQVVSLAYECLRGPDAVGIAIHELMHTVGFFHEQSRNDRDLYVTIDWNNVADNAKDNNFEKYDLDKITHLGTSYDYDSIMHYDMYAFSKNNQPTIRPTRNGVKIGQRRGFSTNDVYKINKLYNCFQLRGQQPINNQPLQRATVIPIIQTQRTTVAPIRQIQTTPIFPSRQIQRTTVAPIRQIQRTTVAPIGQTQRTTIFPIRQYQRITVSPRKTVDNKLQRKPPIVGFNCRSTVCHDDNQCCALWKLSNPSSQAQNQQGAQGFNSFPTQQGVPGVNSYQTQQRSTPGPYTQQAQNQQGVQGFNSFQTQQQNTPGPYTQQAQNQQGVPGLNSYQIQQQRNTPGPYTQQAQNQQGVQGFNSFQTQQSVPGFNSYQTQQPRMYPNSYVNANDGNSGLGNVRYGDASFGNNGFANSGGSSYSWGNCDPVRRNQAEQNAIRNADGSYSYTC